MSSRKTALLFLLVLFSSCVAWSQTVQNPERFRDPLNVHPIDKMVGQVDETQRVVLPGHRHPLARAANLIGQVSPNQPMEKMVLVLRPDTSQEEALAELIRAQQDPSSRYYHQWITPETFGERFGISQNDLIQVANWLAMHGMKVEEIPTSRRTIVFSGTAGQVESTFHTSMQRYSIEGKTHFANATDLEIPREVASVVRGVVALHDFQSQTSHVTAKPTFTNGNGAHFLAPADWNIIYDVGPLLSQGLDGNGQSIAVLGRADITLSDVRTFRSNYGLPAKDPVIIINGADPGFPGCDDEAESTLDVEWAGAIAKNVTVKFVTSKSATTDGITLSAQYAVSNNVAPIITLSYILCEASLGTGGNAFWNGIWAEAASQGQTVFVAAGDSGAAGCDSGSATTATHGKGVNGICSTPYSTCVGGTEFDDNYNPGTYWTPTNGAGGSSVLSYIPELAWDESAWSGGLWSTGGGVSTLYPKPGWQAAPGVPNDRVRDVPDISIAAAIHDAYVVQFQSNLFYFAGTSAATPSLASVMALVLQNTGSTQGNINPILYTLANQQLSAGGPAIFHDITKGSNSVPGLTGYNAGVGYDMASGLGSVDAFMLVNHWSGYSSSNFTLTPNSSSVTVSQGRAGAVTLSETAQGGFNSQVTLSASGAPAGVTVTLSSPTLTSTAPATATISAASNTVAGSYTLTFTGTGGGLTRNVSLTLVVATSTFTLTSNPSTASVAPGSSVPITLTAAGTNGFSSAVALSVSGLPPGVTASFAPTSIASPGSGSSTLTLSVASGTAAGISTVTVTGTGGGVTQSQIIILTVLPSSFNLGLSGSSASVAPGGSIPIAVATAVVNGFNSALALSVSGLPQGATASFAPTRIAAPGSGSSTLTLAATSAAAAGVSTLTVTAAGGGVTKTQTLSLTVTSPGFALSLGAAGVSLAPGGSLPIGLSTTAGNGFNSAITLSVSGVPSGATATFAPSSIAAPGTGKSNLTIVTTSAAAAGVTTLTVTATGGGTTRTQTLSLTVLATFTLSASATGASVARGGSVPITLTTTRGNGFSSAITLSVSGAPSGVTASLTPASIASPGSGSTTLKLSAGSTAAAGVSSLIVIATGGGISRSLVLSLTVQTPTFALAVAAAGFSLAPGGSLPITLTTTVASGFNSAIALSVTGLPSGVTVTLAPSSITAPGNGSSKLTLSASSTAAHIVKTLTVTATGGGITKTQTLSLTVLAPTFTLTTGSTSASVAPAGSTQIILSTAGVNGFKSAITLSISGVPKGISTSFTPTLIAAPGTGSSILKLSAASGTAASTAVLTVTATGGGITRTLSISMGVSAASKR